MQSLNIQIVFVLATLNLPIFNRKLLRTYITLTIAIRRFQANLSLTNHISIYQSRQKDILSEQDLETESVS